MDLSAKGSRYDKFHRDVLVYWHGETLIEDVATKNKRIVDANVTAFDPSHPVGAEPLPPGPASPICAKCELFKTGCKNPFMMPVGAENPLITIICDSVTRKEDEKGQLGIDGFPGWIAKIIHGCREETKVTLDDIRWFPLTRCANCSTVKADYKIKGNWCRYHLVDDLMRHPPQLIVPVGTASLGMLCHKSNAQDWQGKLLTYRGWPDDWLTDQRYVLPRPHPVDLTKEIVGHPIFGEVPKVRIPMMPIQSPHIILSTMNQVVKERWKRTVVNAMKLAKSGVKPKLYTRPWYRFTKDPEVAVEGLREIIRNPGTLVCYDTETTGLKPWSFHSLCKMRLATPPAIVSVMFRWRDPKTGNSRSIGFPWDYEASPMKPHMKALAPLVYEALTKSQLIGHNLTFDVLYTFATLYQKWLVGWDDPEFNKKRDRWLCALADAAKFDTWHAAYTYMQRTGSLGLEIIAYDWAPELAGYEEDMTLLIELHREAMHPAENKGGHYLNCDEKYWPTHVIPYVMGDVESCFLASERLREKLKDTENRRYDIPLAKPGSPGRFRYFTPPSRAWVYDRIMVPAAAVLMKIMGRGMYIDLKKLGEMEIALPKTIRGLRNKLKSETPVIGQWCEEQEQLTPEWELDLENKTQLKDLLFNVLNLPIQRLTKNGKKFYGENATEWDAAIRKAVAKRNQDLTDTEREKKVREEWMDYAATDKFTLNKMAVDHESVRPLQDYRKVYKLYSTYVRPLRNITVTGIDKKARVKEPHLCFDSCIHASFLMTGTRGGRLSCRDPNLQQLPRDGEVKSLYVSRFGDRGCMYQGDLSQIELRLMASACGDPTMIKAYIDETDLHTLTTSRIFNTPYDHFSKDHMKWLQEHGRDKEAKDLSQKRNIGKCVDPSTLVSVNGRITRIGSLHQGREDDTFYPVENMFVQTPTGRQPIKSFYCNGVRDSVLVCTLHGIIKCSLTHKFQLANGALVCAGDLIPGTVLKDGTALESLNEDVSVAFNPFGDEPKSDVFNVHVTEDLAYVLGLFYGDGCSVANRIEITTGGKPEFFGWQDIVAESLERCGFKPIVNRTLFSGTKVSGKLGEVTGAWGSVNFGCTRVQDLFYQLGAIDKKNKWRRTLVVPEWMFNATKGVKTAFIAGVVDTDGYVKSDGSISICSKSPRFAQDLMTLCATIGIACTVAPAWNKMYERYYFVVRIARRDSEPVAEKLRHPDKKGKVKPVRFRYSSRVLNKVKLVLSQPPSVLVDISLDNPHLYVPEGLVTHQTVNFLTGYGGGAFGLQNVLAAKSIYLKIEECESIIESFFASYPALQRLLMHYKQFILEKHVAVSLFGRVRVFEEVLGEDQEAKAKALRAGCNHLIQSTASDMMLIALIAVEQMLKEADVESLLVSTVHDSLLVDCVQSDLPVVHETVMTVLNNFPQVLPAMLGDDFDTNWMLVPFTGDCEVGLDYLSAKAIPKNNIDWDKLLYPSNE